MENIINTVKEIKELEEQSGVPLKKSRRALLKNQLITYFMAHELKEMDLGDWVLVYHPKVKYKRYPNGTIQILSKQGYNNMKNWKAKNYGQY